MSISHQQAFKLLLRGMTARLHFGTGELRAGRLQAEVLAGLEPEPRSQLQAHWAICPECSGDLALFARLRGEYLQRWPLTVAPRRPADDVLRSVQARRHVSARLGQLLAPLRLALIAVLLLGAILVLSWVFKSLRPQPVVLPGAGTPSARPDRTQQSTWTVQPSPTQVETQPAIPKTPLKPFMSTGQLEMGTWSPDGRYLLIVQVEPSSDTSSDRVYTSIHFYDVQTGQVCQAGEPLLGSQFVGDTTAWLPDKRLLVVSSKDVSIYTPCSPQIESITALFDDRIMAVSPTSGKGGHLVLTGTKTYWIFDPAGGTAFPLANEIPNMSGGRLIFWSPDRGAIAISQSAAAGGSRISLVDVQSGRLLEQITVPLGTPEYSPWIDWLLEDVLLVYGGSNQSSILVERQPGAPARLTPVLKGFYGLDIGSSAEITGEGSFGDPQRGTYYLTLTCRSPQKRAIYLYHIDGGRLDILPHDYDTFLFFPDGEVVDLPRLENIPTYTDTFQMVWVDDPARQSRQLVVQGHTPRQYPQLMYAWIPAAGRMAFGSTQGVSLVSIDDGHLIEFWSLEGAENTVNTGLSLSPDGKTLAVQAQLETATQLGPLSALYIVSLPP